MNFQIPKSWEGKVTVLNVYLSMRASRITSRRRAIRAGNRAGLLDGMTYRGGGDRLARAMVKNLAHEASSVVPARWRKLFARSFVKAALFAAHTDHNITASSKYGMT